MWRTHACTQLWRYARRLRPGSHRKLHRLKRHETTQNASIYAVSDRNQLILIKNQLIAVQNNVNRRILCRFVRFNLCNFWCEPGLRKPTLIDLRCHVSHQIVAHRAALKLMECEDHKNVFFFYVFLSPQSTWARDFRCAVFQRLVCKKKITPCVKIVEKNRRNWAKFRLINI